MVLHPLHSILFRPFPYSFSFSATAAFLLSLSGWPQSQNVASDQRTSFMMTAGFLMRQTNTIIVFKTSTVALHSNERSLPSPNLMPLTRNSTMTLMKPCMVLSWPRTWMSPTLNLLKPCNSLPSSNNIGLSSTSVGHSHPCMATSA